MNAEEKFIAEHEQGHGIQQMAALLAKHKVIAGISDAMKDAKTDGIPPRDQFQGIIRIAYAMLTCGVSKLSPEDRIIFAAGFAGLLEDECEHATLLILAGGKK